MTCTTVRTVLGDIDAAQLGRTDYHEHLFQVSPLLPDEDLDDEDASRTEAAQLHAAGIHAMVEATPIGLGRRPDAVARIARATGLHVVLTTGAHRQAHYDPADPITRRSEHELAHRFHWELVTDAQDPDPGDPPVRAGLLKAGIGYWSISPFERRVLVAVAQAHRTTGAPAMVHLEHGSAAVEVLELLAEEGVPATAVALAHMDRNPDPGLHAELCDAGAYVGYDGMARHRNHPDSVLLDCLERTVQRSGPTRVLLGGDVARRSRYRAYGGMPGLDYLPRRFVPRLIQTVGGHVTETVLRTNPAAWLAWRHP